MVEPTICYYYYLWNAIDCVGEDWLRESFESIKGQGDEIIVGDYSSDDGTPELAREYGFKVFNVEKTKGILFHTTKISNKVIFESKSNFIADLDIHITYPKNMDEIIRNWLNNNDITKKQLIIGGLWYKDNRIIRKAYNICNTAPIYRPYLLEARGYDERTYYGWGDSHYIVGLLKNVYKLEFDYVDTDDMVHKDHNSISRNRAKTIFNIYPSPKFNSESVRFGRSLVNKFNVKKVVNSYW